MKCQLEEKGLSKKMLEQRVKLSSKKDKAEEKAIAKKLEGAKEELNEIPGITRLLFNTKDCWRRSKLREMEIG